MITIHTCYSECPRIVPNLIRPPVPGAITSEMVNLRPVAPEILYSEESWRAYWGSKFGAEGRAMAALVFPYLEQRDESPTDGFLDLKDISRDNIIATFDHIHPTSDDGGQILRRMRLELLGLRRAVEILYVTPFNGQLIGFTEKGIAHGLEGSPVRQMWADMRRHHPEGSIMRLVVDARYLKGREDDPLNPDRTGSNRSRIFDAMQLSGNFFLSPPETRQGIITATPYSTKLSGFGPGDLDTWIAVTPALMLLAAAAAGKRGSSGPAPVMAIGGQFRSTGRPFEVSVPDWIRAQIAGAISSGGNRLPTAYMVSNRHRGGSATVGATPSGGVSKPTVSEAPVVSGGFWGWLKGVFGFGQSVSMSHDQAVPSPQTPTLRELPPPVPVVVGLAPPTEVQRKGSRVDQLRQEALRARPQRQVDAIREMLELFNSSRVPDQEILGALSRMIAGGHVQAAQQVGEWVDAHPSHPLRPIIIDMLILGKGHNPEAKHQLARLVPTSHQTPKERPMAALTPLPSPPPPPPQRASPTPGTGRSESPPSANYGRDNFGQTTADPLKTRAIAARDRVLNNCGETANGLKDLQEMVRSGNPHAIPALINIALWRAHFRPGVLDILVEIAATGDTVVYRGRRSFFDDIRIERGAAVDALTAILGDVKLDITSRNKIVSALGRAAQTSVMARNKVFALASAKSAVAPKAFKIVCSWARNGNSSALQHLGEFAKHPNHPFAAEAAKIIAQSNGAGVDAVKPMTPVLVPGLPRRRTPTPAAE